MKRSLVFLATVALAASAFAQAERPSARAPRDVDADNATEMRHLFPTNPDGSAAITKMPDDFDGEDWYDPKHPATDAAVHHAQDLAVNLSYHGGDVINTAHVVCIFWGPTWASGGSDNGRATTIQAFRDQLGTSSHYSMLTQYYDSGAHINTTNLHGSQADWFDTTNALPSNGNVTDSTVRAEVNRYIAKFGSSTTTVYEVFLPKFVPGTSTLVSSSDGSSTSCGGPGLAYCAYHSNNGSIKYSIEPYPSCSGCQVSGWTVVQNMTHFMVHETREAVTDPNGTAWYDSSGQEADDKCAWTGLFLSNGYGYQPEWSNAANGCVQ